MREPLRDREKPLTLRAALAAVIVAIVDHRVLFQIAIIAFAVVALRTWGPEDVNRGIDYVAESAPIRAIGEVVGGAWRVSVDALGLADRTARSANVDVAGGAAAAAQLRAVPTAGSSQTSARRAPVAQTPSAPAGSVGSPATPMPHGGIATADTVARPAARSGSPETIVWSLVNGPDTLRAEVHERGAEGIDLVLVKNGQVWRRERWADRETARAEANLKRAAFEKLGWTVRAH